MTPEMILELGDRQRYTASFDCEPYDYLHEWDVDAWGIFTIAIDRQYKPLELDTFGINDRLQSIRNWHGHDWNTDTLEKAIEKSIKRAGYEFMFLQLKGYSQGDWAYVVLYWRADYITDISGLVNELEAWFKGDVYTICLEELDTYTSDSGRVIERWEVVESIGGVLIHDGNPFTYENCESYVGAPKKEEA
jgi:hypothetical protein